MGFLLLLLGLTVTDTGRTPLGFSEPPGGVCTLGDSVRAQSDTASLRGLIETARRSDRRHRPELAARGAMAALHLGQMTGDRSFFGQALDYLDDARSIYQEDACFFYYRGVIRRELGSRGFFAAEVWARLRNRDYTERAVRDFRRAAQLKPGWLEPAAAMAALSIDAVEGKPGRRARWQSWARAALGAYVDAGGNEPDVDLWRGRLLMEADSFQPALSAFERYPAIPSGLVYLEKASALFALDRGEEAVAAYWVGLEALTDSSAAARVERDLYYIFDPAEAGEWKSLKTGSERAGWVRRFWEHRAARDLVSVSERVAEHHARLRFARKNYRLMSQARPYTVADRVDARRQAEPLDDRALVYIREGEPEKRSRCLGDTMFESWVYFHEDDGPRVVHFSPGRQVDDWQLVGVVPPSCIGRLGYIDGRYNYLAWKLSGSDLDRIQFSFEERNRNERVAQRVLTNDRHRLPLDGRLEFGYEWLFFRGSEPGSIDATLSYAVPVQGLGCRSSDGRRVCELEVRASMFSGDTVLDWRKVPREVALRPGRGEWIMGHFPVAAAPGDWDYRVAAFERPDSSPDGTLRGNWARGRFTIPPLWDSTDSARVTVSSLVLAQVGEGNWTRDGESLALNPLHAYPPGASVDIYYEIYGIPDGYSYTTELTLLRSARDLPVSSLDPPVEWVSKRLGKDRVDLQLRFEESASSDDRPWIARRRTLVLSGAQPGKYILVLGITPTDRATTVYRVTPLLIDREGR